MDQQMEKYEVNLLDLFHYLKKKLLIIVAAALVFAVAGYVYYSFFVTRQYVAETRMYVLKQSGSSGVVSSDFQASSYMLNDYKVLITGKNVTEEVISVLDLDLTSSKLSQMIEISAPSGTRVLQIRVTDTEAQRAADIANAVREVATNQIQSIMEVDAVHLIYEAEVPRAPIGTQAVKKSLLAAAIGAALAILVLAVVFAVDDSIRNEEDVERYLGLSVLGVIPLSNDISTEAEKSAQMKLKHRKKADKK